MPAEVEAVLLAHPAVAEAGVLGRPDPRVGGGRHRVRRARRGGARTSCARSPRRGWRRSRFQRRSSRGALPRNAAGKLLRRELRRTSSGREVQSSSLKRRTLNPCSEHGVAGPGPRPACAGRVVAAVDLDVEAGPAEVDLEAV